MHDDRSGKRTGADLGCRRQLAAQLQCGLPLIAMIDCCSQGSGDTLRRDQLMHIERIERMFS